MNSGFSVQASAHDGDGDFRHGPVDNGGEVPGNIGGLGIEEFQPYDVQDRDRANTRAYPVISKPPIHCWGQ